MAKPLSSFTKHRNWIPICRYLAFFLQQAYEGKGDFASASNEWQQVALGFGEKPEIVNARAEKLRRGFTEGANAATGRLNWNFSRPTRSKALPIATLLPFSIPAWETRIELSSASKRLSRNTHKI
jgi:hypothetical protein